MPTGRKPTYKEDSYEWVRLYVEEGLSLSQIGKRYGCALTTVRRWLLIHGVEMRPAQLPPGYADTRISKEEIKRTVELYRSGLSLKQVGDEMFLSAGAVHNRLKKAGVRRRPAHTYAFARRKSPAYHREMQQAIFLYEKMLWSFDEIGKLQNHNGHTIAKRFRKAGIAIRSRSDAQKIAWKKGRRVATSRNPN